MDRQEQLNELQRSIADFEERFQRIIISKQQQPTRSHSDSTLLPISSEFYRGRIPSVTLNKDLQSVLILKQLNADPAFRTGVPVDQIANREVPQSSKEMTLNFSREERLLLYDYCVSATGHHSIPDVPFSYPESDSPGSSTRTVTFAEIAALEKKRRKRRRMSAKDKATGSSSSKVTYTEELRSLIDTQMNAWTAFLRESKKRTRRENPSVKRLK